MDSGARRFALFPQALDRAVFLAYLLGAVVPLSGLGWVVERYALPTLRENTNAAALVALVCSIAALSLGSFFVMRRLIRHTLARMDDDNERLAALVEVSGALADAPHGGEVARTVAGCALRLARARAALVFLRPEQDKPPALAAHAGKDAEALYEKARAGLDELVRMALESGRPALRDSQAKKRRTDISAVAAMPFGKSGAVVAVRSGHSASFEPPQIDSLSTLASLALVALHNAQLRDAQKNFFAHVTDILVSALDTHLAVHTGHSRRVAHFSNVMAHQLSFGDDRLQRLHFAALLHDIGFLKIDRDRQTHRPTVQKHPMLGYRMLHPIQLWEDIAPFVHHHHEWWDGSGYPEALAGDAIPLEARIIAIAEAFDTMTSEKSYKPARSVQDALREVEQGAGTQFDPELATLFVSLVREGKVRVNEGQ